MTEAIDSLKSRPDDMASHYNLGNLVMSRDQMRDAVRELKPRRASNPMRSRPT